MDKNNISGSSTPILGLGLAKNNSPQLAEPGFNEDMDFNYHGEHSFYQQLSIHIDQPVTAMSISPSKRDIVLAGRQGLLIVDLESPFGAPRSLPYFSRWEVSETQWNPHASRDTWIATTCNHKALIWNLLQPKLHSVEFVLTGHQRAISDLNWSNMHPEILGTASLDTSIKLWDLRVPSHQPIHTFMNWNLAVSQIDFHHSNEFLFATGQESELRIWDIRRGSHPVHIVAAHDRKIANICWNNTSSSEILTCSYDRTIKFWDTNDLTQCTGMIETKMPIARARYTPFGRGVISIPLRCENDLYLWDKTQPSKPVFRYQGHTGIVKEFVWRIHGNVGSDGNSDGREFQLITFSLDRQLRLWPVGDAQLKAVGHQPDKNTSNESRAQTVLGGVPNSSFSYRTPRHSTISIPSPVAQLSNNWSLHRKSSIEDTLCGTSPSNENSLIPLVPQRVTQIPHTSFDFLASSDAASGWMRTVHLDERLKGNPKESEKDWVLRSLAEEFGIVTQLFKRVKFEKVNVSGRSCTITLHGPWAKDGGPAFLRVNIRFPAEYPNKVPPFFELHKSGMMSMANRAVIVDCLHRIAQSYVAKNRYCLQACISYLLGEKPPEEHNFNLAFGQGDSDGSDDDSRFRRRIQGSRDAMGIERDDQNVPFPRMCGGVFGSNGQLILYFSSLNASPVTESGNSVRVLLRSSYYQAHPRSYESLELFRTMTRLPPRIISNRRSEDLSPTSEDPDELDDLLTIPSLFYRPNNHQRVSQGDLQTPTPDQIFNAAAEDLQSSTLAPDKISGNMVIFRTIPGMAIPDINLATGYQVLGRTFPQLLAHNRQIAKMRGRKDLAWLWKLLGRILLFLTPENKNRNKHCSVVKPPLQKNHLKILPPSSFMLWGSHPFGRQIIQSLLRRYESFNDVQTLGMLACILDSFKVAAHISYPDSGFKAQVGPVNFQLGAESPKDYFSSSFYRKNTKSSQIESDTGRFSQSTFSSQFPYSLWGTNSGATSAISPAGRVISRPLAVDPSLFSGSPPLKTAPLPTIPPNSLMYTPPVHLPPTSIAKRDGYNVSPKSFNMFLGSLNSSSLLQPPQISSHSRKSSDFQIYDSTGGLVVQDTGEFIEDAFEGPGSYSTTHSRDCTRNQAPISSIIKPTVSNAINFSESAEKISRVTHELLSPEEEITLEHYRFMYAETLYKWGLLVSRAELLKHSTFPENEMHQGLEFEPMCSSCNGPLKSISNFYNSQISQDNELQLKMKICVSCDRRRQFPKCCVCNLVVKGLSSYCGICGHGGHFDHMQAWFQGSQQNPECPTGCGCVCLESRGGF